MSASASPIVSSFTLSGELDEIITSLTQQQVKFTQNAQQNAALRDGILSFVDSDGKFDLKPLSEEWGQAAIEMQLQRVSDFGRDTFVSECTGVVTSKNNDAKTAGELLAFFTEMKAGVKEVKETERKGLVVEERVTHKFDTTQEKLDAVKGMLKFEHGNAKKYLNGLTPGAKMALTHFLSSHFINIVPPQHTSASLPGAVALVTEALATATTSTTTDADSSAPAAPVVLSPTPAPAPAPAQSEPAPASPSPASA